jgi:nucleoside-diphosphate-sugar epimerase
MKRALVCGAGGFIASHLVKRLKADGYWVLGVDIKQPEFSRTAADEFRILDLREPRNAEEAVRLTEGPRREFDEVYQLAADMGGMGFIHSAEADIMRNNALININMAHAAATSGAKRYFFSSSVCIYRDMAPGEPELTEEQAYPANPDNEYGWEKLYAERVAAVFGRRNKMVVRIARFQNCYGPEGTWIGGREKAPAAICRKVAEIDDNGTIEVWGDGTAIRSYTYVDDMVDGIRKLTDSGLEGAANIGLPEYVSVKQLVDTVAEVAKKKVNVKNVRGPVGVQSRNFSNDRIYTTGWKPKFSLRAGIQSTYPWIEAQVLAARRGSASRPNALPGGGAPRLTSNA